MTRNSTSYNIELFINSLLAFNNLSLNCEFVDALFKNDELALGGGLLFERSNIVITSSCCADFQDWVDVVNDIKQKNSPWMGHDPSPYFEFEGEYITLWSDEPESTQRSFIRFTQTEFDRKLFSAKKELNSFCKKFEIWAVKNYQLDPTRLINGVKHYLSIN